MSDPSLLGPGKLAPRLIEDLLCYDPQVPHEYNVLRDPPPKYQEGVPAKYRVPANSCQHDFTLKPSQSELRERMREPDPTTLFRVAAICQGCSLHIDFVVHFHKPQTTPCRPCPALLGLFPVHHLCHAGSEVSEEWEQHTFECSANVCPATVIVNIKKPRLKSRLRKLLTDPEIVARRDRLARASNPSRFNDLAVSNPATVVSTLFQYLDHELKSEAPEGGRKVNSSNKQFMTTLGDDGAEVLSFLGWQQVGEHWLIPSVEHHGETLDPKRVFLEDVCEELKFLILRERKKFKPRTDVSLKNHDSAFKEFQRCLTCADSEVNRKKVDSKHLEHPHYASLGVTRDTKEDLMEFAHARQRLTDPLNAPYYLDCLAGLAEGRKSETLQILVAKFRSQGEVGQKEILAAYGYFQLDSQAKDLVDADIINVFRARLEDSSKAQEAEMRHHLSVIGRIRQSAAIMSFANKTIESYDDALAYLEADRGTHDEFITVMATTKMTDNKEETPKARLAVELIAKERNSQSLRAWLQTGQIDEIEMDARHAYSRLGLDDATIDDNTVISIFEMRVDDSPDQLTELRAALRAIGKERSSALIETFLRDGKDVQISGSADWPVGLNNIGNTCYLNSLLQYLFSIRPLREKLWDMDMIDVGSLELAPDGKSVKRILSTRVTPKQVNLSQEFVVELRKLFGDLIRTEFSSITPAHNLAIRTLMPLDDGRNRRMTLSSNDERPVYGPQLPPKGTLAEDSSSDGTLVEKDSPIEPNGDTKMTGMNSQLTPPSSPDHGAMDLDPPERPPPVPPRPSEKNLSEDELSRQQDVAEVFGNVLLQLECAIRPEALDEKNEQLDFVKWLFYGKTRNVTMDKKGRRENEEWFSDIKINAAAGPSDIYSALDGAFDEQQVIVDNQQVPQYTSIYQLPQVLQVFIQRSHWNQERKQQYKDESHIAMEDVIYLDRYLDPSVEGAPPELLTRRREAWRLKKSLAGLRRRKDKIEKTELDVPVPKALETTRHLVNSLDVDDLVIVQPSVEQTLAEAVAQSTRELKAINQTIAKTEQKLSAMFNDLKSFPYRLHAVFMHRGSSTFGHYWLHMYDASSGGIWRKYNDANVSTVTQSEVFDSQESVNGPKATPYFLVYVRDDMHNELAQPLCRQPATATKEPEKPTDAVEPVKISESSGASPSKGKAKDFERGG